MNTATVPSLVSTLTDADGVLGTLETYRAAALSTAHLRPDDIRAIERMIGDHHPQCRFMSRDTGFFVKLYGPSDDDDNHYRDLPISGDLVALLQAFDQSGFHLVEFDADASELNGLPVYD